MIRDHLTANELAGYAQRTAGPEELLRASDHLAECENCRAKLRQLDARASRETDAVAYEQLADFLDDNLDPMEKKRVAEQLARSPASAAELADLARFRNESDELSPVTHDEISTATERKIISFPQRFARRLLPLAAGLIIGAVGAWFIARNASHANKLVLRDGGRAIVLDRAGRVTGLPRLPDQMRRAVASVLKGGKLAIPADINALAGEHETLAGSPNESKSFHIIAPVATVVREVQPRFHWSAQPDAQSYRVHIVDARSGESIATGATAAGMTVWTPEQPLPADGVYQWQVDALRDDRILARSPKPPEPEARFQIVSDEARQKLEKIESAASGTHLVRAIAEAEAGLLDDALRDLRAFAAENPDSKLPAELIAQIEDARQAKR